MSSMRDFYSARTILVTGGTGFMGKVLLEKMIRSLTDLKRIYVLVRPKKGLTPEERIQAMVAKVPFTFHESIFPNLKKLQAIHGDITEENLGLSNEDRQTILDEVSIVFNIAASIRMDLSLKIAIQTNTISTINLLNLCTEIKNLVSVVHLTTAFCNVDIEYMEEKVYDIKLDPYKIIEMVEWLDDESLAKIEKRIMAPHPNSYTFTKRLSEIIAMDMGKKLPISIGRPSIVVAAFDEPIPGWIDSINGPVGILLAGGKGVLKTSLTDKDSYPQMITVDSAINSLITMAYVRTKEKFSETPVYNLTNADVIKLTWGEIAENYKKLAIKYPLTWKLWYPSGSNAMHKNYFLHYFYWIFCHMVPAYIIDFLLILFLQKPFLVNVHKRINLGLKLLAYFSLKQFTFTNKNAMQLQSYLSKEEEEIFNMYKDEYDLDAYYYASYMSSRLYCVNEKIENLPLRRIEIKCLYVLDKFCDFSIAYGVLYFVLYLFGATYLLSYNFWFVEK